jgi:hypothetical protein
MIADLRVRPLGIAQGAFVTNLPLEFLTTIGRLALGDEAPTIVERTMELHDSGFARRRVVSLLRHGVLCRGVTIAQPPLQRRCRIERAATAEREARIKGADGGGGDSYPGLRVLRDEADDGGLDGEEIVQNGFPLGPAAPQA